MSTYLFPPALVGFARERLARKSPCLLDVTDDQLAQLFTTIFFAGLETYEGDHYPIGVAFIGRSTADFIISEGAKVGALPLYRWKILRFAVPRPLSPRELVKLAVAGADRRIFSAVNVLPDDTLAIAGLAREGFTAGRDPFVKVLASRPGFLSIRRGHDLVLEYEGGAVVTVGDDEVFSAGRVHRALAAIAQRAGVDPDVVSHYVETVAFLVREIGAHGHGGILIISADERPVAAESAPYRMALDSSLAALLRLGWRAGGQTEGRPRDAHPPARPETPAFGELLRNAFLTEAERVVEELGRLSAIDGAVLLNRDLALVAFGVILPVRQDVTVEHGADGDRDRSRPVEFGSRGTRHRAAATYATEHPGDVIFVASEDGQVSCIFREQADAPVRLWYLTSDLAHSA